MAALQSCGTRRTQAKLLGPQGRARAFADDAAVVTEDVFEKLGGIATFFEEYGRLSGLDLNYSKTAIVPLWHTRDEGGDGDQPQQGDGYGALRARLRQVGGGWEDVQIQGKAKYLGFFVGPERGEDAWDKAILKWESRVNNWVGKGLGLQYSALVYNVFCASVLGFLGQLLEVPRKILDREEVIIKKLATVPKAWANLPDLCHVGKMHEVGRSIDCN